MSEIRLKLIYKINKDQDSINILSNEFIKRNKIHWKILYKNKIYKSMNEFKDFDKNKDKLKILLIGLSNQNFKFNYMFKNCSSLIEFTKIAKRKNFIDIQIYNFKKNLESEFSESDSLSASEISERNITTDKSFIINFFPIISQISKSIYDII